MTRLDRLKIRLYKLAMKHHKGNKTHACAYIGISIKTLRNWEIHLGLEQAAHEDMRPFKQKTKFYNGIE